VKKILVKTCFLCPHYIPNYTALGQSLCTDTKRFFKPHEGYRIPEWCSLGEDSEKELTEEEIRADYEHRY
jgi:hypothetical protein